MVGRVAGLSLQEVAAQAVTGREVSRWAGRQRVRSPSVGVVEAQALAGAVSGRDTIPSSGMIRNVCSAMGAGFAADVEVVARAGDGLPTFTPAGRLLPFIVAASFLCSRAPSPSTLWEMPLGSSASLCCLASGPGSAALW